VFQRFLRYHFVGHKAADALLQVEQLGGEGEVHVAPILAADLTRMNADRTMLDRVGPRASAAELYWITSRRRLGFANDGQQM